MNKNYLYLLTFFAMSLHGMAEQQCHIEEIDNNLCTQEQEGLLAGTLVKVPMGYIPVEKLVVGDLIISRNENGILETDIVTAIQHQHVQEAICVTVGGKDVVIANGHKLFAPIIKKWIEARHMSYNDHLMLFPFNEAVIEDIKIVQGNFKVIAISVEHNHNFFISEQDILVHNMMADLAARAAVAAAKLAIELAKILAAQAAARVVGNASESVLGNGDIARRITGTLQGAAYNGVIHNVDHEIHVRQRAEQTRSGGATDAPPSVGSIAAGTAAGVARTFGAGTSRTVSRVAEALHVMPYNPAEDLHPMRVSGTATAPMVATPQTNTPAGSAGATAADSGIATTPAVATARTSTQVLSLGAGNSTDVSQQMAPGTAIVPNETAIRSDMAGVGRGTEGHFEHIDVHAQLRRQDEGNLSTRPDLLIPATTTTDGHSGELVNCSLAQGLARVGGPIIANSAPGLAAVLGIKSAQELQQDFEKQSKAIFHVDERSEKTLSDHDKMASAPAGVRPANIPPRVVARSVPPKVIPMGAQEAPSAALTGSTTGFVSVAPEEAIPLSTRQAMEDLSHPTISPVPAVGLVYDSTRGGYVRPTTSTNISHLFGGGRDEKADAIYRQEQAVKEEEHHRKFLADLQQYESAPERAQRESEMRSKGDYKPSIEIIRAQQHRKEEALQKVERDRAAYYSSLSWGEWLGSFFTEEDSDASNALVMQKLQKKAHQHKLKEQQGKQAGGAGGGGSGGDGKDKKDLLAEGGAGLTLAAKEAGDNESQIEGVASRVVDGIRSLLTDTDKKERVFSCYRWAKEVGLKRIKQPPFDSHGQKVFQLPKSSDLITPDADAHIGGWWKLINRHGKRIGTLDKDLKLIQEG